MIYVVSAFNQDYDYISDHVAYTFSDEDKAQECHETLKTVYSDVTIFNPEINEYPRPHKIYTCTLYLETGKVQYQESYSYNNDVESLNYSWGFLLKQDIIGSGQINRYSLISSEDAYNKCQEIYNKVKENRTLVHGKYKSKVWVLNNNLDKNFIYEDDSYLVNGKTGESRLKNPKIYVNPWSFLEIRASG